MAGDDEIPTAPKRRFMVLVHPCRPDFWATLSPSEATIIVKHYQRLHELQERGKLEFGGRDNDDRYGLMILQMESEEEVRTAFADNPAIEAELLRLEVRPYNLAMDRDLD